MVIYTVRVIIVVLLRPVAHCLCGVTGGLPCRVATVQPASRVSPGTTARPAAMLGLGRVGGVVSQTARRHARVALLTRAWVAPVYRSASSTVSAAGSAAPAHATAAAASPATADVAAATRAIAADAAAAEAAITEAAATIAVLTRKLRRRRLLRALAALALLAPAVKVYLAVRPLRRDGGQPEKDESAVALPQESRQELPVVSWHWLVSEASDRLIRDVYTAAVIVLDYAAVMRAGEEDWSAVHQRGADRLLKLCQVNRGIYIKLGQHVAQLEYMLPAQYVTTMAVTTHAAPQDSWETARAVLQEELGSGPGRGIDDVFASLDRTPIASASLAQVHVGVLRATGEKVAVKIQHRGVLLSQL
jgi:hypothetical protein